MSHGPAQSAGRASPTKESIERPFAKFRNVTTFIDASHAQGMIVYMYLLH
jgi:hypothetical protein